MNSPLTIYRLRSLWVDILINIYLLMNPQEYPQSAPKSEAGLGDLIWNTIGILCRGVSPKLKLFD